MAIHSDDTFVTKGDLKTLYTEKILPYLGGNLALKTNVSDYYDATEKIVGVWTDGRPIYKRTFSGTLSAKPSPTSANFELVNTDVELTGIQVKEFIHFEGFYKGTTNSMQPIGCVDPYPQSVSNIITRRGTRLVAFPDDYSGSLFKNGFRIVSVGSNTATDPFNVPYFVTIWYTKVTDAANSAVTTPGCYDINFPNTWPANQEIFFGNGLYGYKYVGTTGSSNTTFSVGSNIKKLISYGGYIASNTNNLVPIGSYWTPTNYICAPYTTNSNFILMYSTSGSSYANKQAEIWATYTK